MTEKIRLIDHLDKRDLEIILEVNKRAIEIGAEAIDQNEDIIRYLESGKSERAEIIKKVDEVSDVVDEIKLDLFKIKILYVGGLLAIVGNVISRILKTLIS